MYRASGLLLIVVTFHWVVLQWIWGASRANDSEFISRPITVVLQVHTIKPDSPISAPPIPPSAPPTKIAVRPQKPVFAPSTVTLPQAQVDPIVAAPVVGEAEQPTADSPSGAAALEPVQVAAMPPQEEVRVSELPAVVRAPLTPEYPDIALGLGKVTQFWPERELAFVGYLNGGAVARATYRFKPIEVEANIPKGYEASFIVQATGLTAWVWRGERLESVRGTLSASGLTAGALMQRQAQRPARTREVSAGTIDLVSVIFQLAHLGVNFPGTLTPGFSAQIALQKVSRVDMVQIQVLDPETLDIGGKPVLTYPIALIDANRQSATSESRTIWFAPSMDWAPVKLVVVDSKLTVEFRSTAMAPLETRRNSDY
jgi:Protein of unknown function (DUF3108)